MPGFTEVENRILKKYISDLKLSRSLTSIRGVMESIWAEEAPRIVKDFTDHGEKHSERLAYFAEKLLLVNPDAKFTQQEIYLLLAGIYLHDIGMQCDIAKYPEIKKKAEILGAKFDETFTSQNTNEYSVEEQKEIRKNHHLLSAAWIDYLYEGKDPVLSHGIKSVPYDLVDDLMDVCKFHSKLSINGCLDNFNDYPTSRKRMVAALLRFADELDISSTRVKIETVKIFSITPENRVYWWLHNYTKIDFVESNIVRLKVDLHPEDFELYGSFVREDYITNFVNKNKPVLDVLVGQKIPIIIDNKSDVVAHQRVEKFPPDITAVLDEKMQRNVLSLDLEIPTTSKASELKTVHVSLSQTVQEPKGTISNVPYSRNLRFTGREDKLKQIREALLADNTVAVSQPIAVCGLGGIGKTQTAVEYTYRYHTEYEFIFWTKADSENSIISDYVGIAKLLNLPVKNDSDLNNIVSAVLNWFRTHENWLLVIDNADDISFVKRYLPPDPKGHILLTSRSRVFDALEITMLVEMEEMSPDEAKSFLLKRTRRYDPQQSELEALEKLVHELGYLPLALEQAGAFIYANNSSFKDYLVSYNIRGLKLLEKSSINKSKYPESISTTWLMNFEEVKKKSKITVDILFVSAFLNPHEILKEIFDKGADELGPLISSAFTDTNIDPLVFDEVLNPLWQYSLINRDAGSRSFDIHRLVQAVIRDGMEKSEQKLWAERVVKAINRAFPEVEYKNWELCDKFLPHAQICSEYIRLWDLETEESATLLNEAGSYLHKRARFKESEALLKGSLEIREKILEPEHFEISESLSNLGILYKDLGRYLEAEPLYLRSLEIRENTLNSDDPEIAKSLNNLGVLYKILGRYSKAEQLHTRALEIREAALKPDDPDIAASLNNLAGIYCDLARYSEAEPLCTRALKVTERALGSEHPDVSVCLSTLALVYRDLSKYTEAESLCTRALEIAEKALGPEHPDVGTYLNNLALVYKELGKYNEAEPLCTRALEITEKTLGPEHPYVGKRLNSLTAVYSNLGKYAEAELLCMRALEITEKALGPEHLDVGNRLNNLATVYSDLGKYTEAEPLYTRALEITERVLGPEHPHVGTCLQNLAVYYYNQHKYRKARPYYEQAIRIMEKTKGENNLELASLLESYSSLLENMRKNREATTKRNRAKRIRSNIEKENKK